MSLPDDLRIAYETFTLLATNKGYSFAGLMMITDPPQILAIGNVRERGHDLAALFRVYADILDEKTDKGQIQTESTPSGVVN